MLQMNRKFKDGQPLGNNKTEILKINLFKMSLIKKDHFLMTWTTQVTTVNRQVGVRLNQI
jgi:hypothetical protein